MSEPTGNGEPPGASSSSSGDNGASSSSSGDNGASSSSGGDNGASSSSGGDNGGSSGTPTPLRCGPLDDEPLQLLKAGGEALRVHSVPALSRFSAANSQGSVTGGWYGNEIREDSLAVVLRPEEGSVDRLNALAWLESIDAEGRAVWSGRIALAADAQFVLFPSTDQVVMVQADPSGTYSAILQQRAQPAPSPITFPAPCAGNKQPLVLTSTLSPTTTNHSIGGLAVACPDKLFALNLPGNAAAELTNLEASSEELVWAGGGWVATQARDGDQLGRARYLPPLLAGGSLPVIDLPLAPRPDHCAGLVEAAGTSTHASAHLLCKAASGHSLQYIPLREASGSIQREIEISGSTDNLQDLAAATLLTVSGTQVYMGRTERNSVLRCTLPDSLSALDAAPNNAALRCTDLRSFDLPQNEQLIGLVSAKVSCAPDNLPGGSTAPLRAFAMTRHPASKPALGLIPLP